MSEIRKGYGVESDPSPVDVSEQILCVMRELALRRRVYPQRVRAGLMRDSDARREILAMESVLSTLKTLRLDGAITEQDHLPFDQD